jgi:hypothetical protein
MPYFFSNPCNAQSGNVEEIPLQACKPCDMRHLPYLLSAVSKQLCPKNNPKINTMVALDSQALCMYQRYGEAHERSTADLEFQHISTG